MSNLKDVTELAAILQCKPITVYRLVKSGKIPHRRIGAFLRFTDEDIENFIVESAKDRKAGGKYEA
jgi:excisionase family DNA binding protein